MLCGIAIVTHRNHLALYDSSYKFSTEGKERILDLYRRDRKRDGIDTK